MVVVIIVVVVDVVDVEDVVVVVDVKVAVADVVVVDVFEVERVNVEVIVSGTVDILELFSLRLNGLGFHFILIFAKIDDSIAVVIGCSVVVTTVVATVVAKWRYLFLKSDKRPVL